MKKLERQVAGIRCWRLAFAASGVCLLIVLVAVEAFARVGGGQSYGGKGGGDGDGDGGAILWLVFQLFRVLLYLTIEYPIIGIPLDMLVIAGVIYFFWRRGQNRQPTIFSTGAVTAAATDPSGVTHSDGFARAFAQLQKFDPNFSEIVFTDFSYALFSRAHEARGRGDKALDLLSPYLSQSARSSLLQRSPPGLKEVKGIIIGSMAVSAVRGLDTPLVQISLLFDANYTEVLQTGGSASETAYYVRERWDLERRRDVLSPTPAQATALHCPRCGAALQQDTIGACAFCGTKIESGEFQWYVQRIDLLSREDRGPLLTSDVPEVGTDLPSVVQPGFDQLRSEFEKNHPEFSWRDFQARAAVIFNELQTAWSALDWERARPHETDNIFQMHQYWIDAYRRQGLRNVLDRFAIHAMQPVKIKEDAFYNAITLRIGAQGFDYTIDGNGRVISGSQNVLRSWSEYWTFIRNRNAPAQAARADLNCPNCGAPLKVNVSGVCAFCGGKITSGEFDWVLSRIEQDESYVG